MILGIAANVLLSLVAHILELPIYLDTIGTMTTAALCGLLPGILTAVVTNTIGSLFEPSMIYFGIGNVLMAVQVAWFVKKRDLGKIGPILRLILETGLVSGGVGTLIEWWLFGDNWNSSITHLLSSPGLEEGAGKYASYLLINLGLNLFDKALAVLATAAVLRYLPEKIREGIASGSWRMRPLSAGEMKTLNALGKTIRFSQKKRVTLTFVVLSMGLVFLTGIVSIRLYFNNAIEEKKKNAINAALFASKIVDGDRLDEYLREGDETPGYQETRELLRMIRENASGVRYLYVVRVGEEGITFLFDLEEREEFLKYSDEEPYEIGDRVPIEEEFEPYQEELLKGERIPVVESERIWGWIATAYEPILDSNGNCVAYAGADASIDIIAGYSQDFFLRILLIMAGYFLLIVTFGLWTTEAYMTYPIGSIVVSVEDFIGAGSDQAKQDEILKRMKAIDIHTGDEMEMLYGAVCSMAENQTEQLRSLRRLAENTAKMQDGLIITMADLVENRDSDTGAHIQKISAYVRIILEGLRKKGYYAEKITPKFISDVVRSAPLHDVGKINIPDYVLNKPGKLTEEEYEIMKTHTTEGKRIMEKAIDTLEGENYLKEARNMAAYHHERWDGKGYPEGLHGEVIPLSARIMAVADVFDALSSPRVYKSAVPLDEALAMLKEEAGSQLDPKCVEVFVEALPEIRVVLRKYNK